MTDSKESDLWDLGRTSPIQEAAAGAALWLMQEDLAALLRALQMGDHARAQTPHAVMLEAIQRAAETYALCMQLATVALNPKVADYLPFGLLDEVRAWLRS